MDEVSYPMILAWQLGKISADTWTHHVRPAEESVVSHGPRTEEERWEEVPGYSPSGVRNAVRLVRFQEPRHRKMGKALFPRQCGHDSGHRCGLFRSNVLHPLAFPWLALDRDRLRFYALPLLLL